MITEIHVTDLLSLLTSDKILFFTTYFTQKKMINLSESESRVSFDLFTRVKMRFLHQISNFRIQTASFRLGWFFLKNYLTLLLSLHLMN